MNSVQGKLNKLAKKFQPKKTVKVVYVQPQKRNGRVEYIQPRKTTN